MRFQIMREMELTMVPTNLLRDPNLSLATKGAAAVLFSYADLHSTSDELTTLLGVSEERAIAICILPAIINSAAIAKSQGHICSKSKRRKSNCLKGASL